MEGLQNRLVAPKASAVPADAGESRAHLALEQKHNPRVRGLLSHDRPTGTRETRSNGSVARWRALLNQQLTRCSLGLGGSNCSTP